MEGQTDEGGIEQVRYGLPYKGSKNLIAEWVVDNLPPAEVFVDLFFGGGAVTHRAMLTGKYKRFIVNDIDARLPKLFLECAYGKHTVDNHPEWISREEFHRLKNSDAYVALVWSFGNNGKDYMYGADLEEYKHGLHMACFHNDLSILSEFGINLKKSTKADVYERYLDYSRQIGNMKHNMLESFTRLQALEHLQSLQSLQSYGTDYRNVPIPDNALIYCDIPYIGTNCGKYDGFNHGAFYEWARQQSNIFISEYSMPDDFIEVANTEKIVLSSASRNDIKTTERIYTNHRTYDSLSDDFKAVIATNTAQQITIYDFLEDQTDDQIPHGHPRRHRPAGPASESGAVGTGGYGCGL